LRFTDSRKEGENEEKKVEVEERRGGRRLR
jgi:hypothetical protein